MKITCFWKGPNALGESPLWHSAEKKLYWLDLVRNTLHCMEATGKNYQEWQLPDPVGAIVPRSRGGLVATLGNKVVGITLPALTIETLAEIKPWPSDVLPNEGKCDRKGRFWFGVASRNVDNPTGGLYCLDPEGRLTQQEKKITIANGLGFSPDNKKFYFTDGLRYCIYEYDFNLQIGTIHNRRVFFAIR